MVGRPHAARLVPPKPHNCRSSGDSGGRCRTRHEYLGIQYCCPPAEPAATVQAYSSERANARATCRARVRAGGVPIRGLDGRRLLIVCTTGFVVANVLSRHKFPLREPQVADPTNLTGKSGAAGCKIVLRMERPSPGQEDGLLQEGRG